MRSRQSATRGNVGGAKGDTDIYYFQKWSGLAEIADFFPYTAKLQIVILC